MTWVPACPAPDFLRSKSAFGRASASGGGIVHPRGDAGGETHSDFPGIDGRLFPSESRNCRENGGRRRKGFLGVSSESTGDVLHSRNGEKEKLPCWISFLFPPHKRPEVLREYVCVLHHVTSLPLIVVAVIGEEDDASVQADGGACL